MPRAVVHKADVGRRMGTEEWIYREPKRASYIAKSLDLLSVQFHRTDKAPPVDLDSGNNNGDLGHFVDVVRGIAAGLTTRSVDQAKLTAID